MFTALRDPDRFAEAHVRDGVVRWPGDLDLAPDAMYDEMKHMGCGSWNRFLNPTDCLRDPRDPRVEVFR